MPIMCIAFANNTAPTLPPSNEDSNDPQQQQQHEPHKLLQSSTHSLSSASSDYSTTSSTSLPCTCDQEPHHQQQQEEEEDEQSLSSPTGLLLKDELVMTQKPKKCVKFSDAEPDIIAYIKPSSCMSLEERSKVHWQIQDYEYFRGTARIIASEILKLSSAKCTSAAVASHSYDTVLTRAHQYCSQHQCCYSDDDYDDDKYLQEERGGDPDPQKEHGLDDTQYSGYELCENCSTTQSQSHVISQNKVVHTYPPTSSQKTCVHLPSNLFAALAHWTRAGHSRRGLEKFCIPHHMQTRPLERQAGVDAVLIAQELLRKVRRNAASDPDSTTAAAAAATEVSVPDAVHKKKNVAGSKEEGTFRLGKWSFSLAMSDEEILRILSERFSATARKFATAMGHADASAVGNYEYHDAGDG